MSIPSAIPWHMFSSDLQSLRDEANRRKNQPLFDYCSAATLSIQSSIAATSAKDIGRVQKAEEDASEALWQVFAGAAETLKGSKFALIGIAGLGKLAAANLMLPTQVQVTCSMLKNMIYSSATKSTTASASSSSTTQQQSSQSQSSSSHHHEVKPDEDIHMRVAQTLCSMLCSDSGKISIEGPLSVSMLLYATTPFPHVQAAAGATILQVTTPLLEHLIPEFVSGEKKQQHKNSENNADDAISPTKTTEPHLQTGAAQVSHMQAVYLLRDCFILGGWTSSSSSTSGNDNNSVLLNMPRWLKLEKIENNTNKHSLSVLCLDILLNFFSTRDGKVQKRTSQQPQKNASENKNTTNQNINISSSAEEEVEKELVSKTRLPHVAKCINETFVPVFCSCVFSPSQAIFTRFHRLVVAVVGQLWSLFELKKFNLLLEKNIQLMLGGGGPAVILKDDEVCVPSTEAGWRIMSVVSQWRRVVSVVGLLPKLMQFEYDNDESFDSPLSEMIESQIIISSNKENPSTSSSPTTGQQQEQENSKNNNSSNSSEEALLAFKKQETSAFQKNPLIRLLLCPARVLEAMVSAQQTVSAPKNVIWAPELVGVLVDFTTSLCQALARWFCSDLKNYNPRIQKHHDAPVASAAAAASSSSSSSSTTTSIHKSTKSQKQKIFSLTTAHSIFDVVFSQLYCCFALALSRLSGEDVLHSALKAVVHLVTCACVVKHAEARDAFLLLMSHELRGVEKKNQQLHQQQQESSPHHHHQNQQQQHSSQSRHHHHNKNKNTNEINTNIDRHHDDDDHHALHSPPNAAAASLLTERKIHILNTVVSIANGLGNDLGHSWRFVVQCFLIAQNMICASQRNLVRFSSGESSASPQQNSSSNINNINNNNSGNIVEEQELKSASFAMEHLFENTCACFSNDAILTLAHFLAQNSSDDVDEKSNRILPQDPLESGTKKEQNTENKNNSELEKIPFSEIEQQEQEKEKSTKRRETDNISPILVSRLNSGNLQTSSSPTNINTTTTNFFFSPSRAQRPLLSSEISADSLSFIFQMFFSMIRCTLTSPVLYNNNDNNNNNEKNSCSTENSHHLPQAEFRFVKCIWPAIKNFLVAVCRTPNIPKESTFAAISFCSDVVGLLSSQATTQTITTTTTTTNSQQQQNNNNNNNKKNAANIPISHFPSLMSLPIQVFLELFQRSDSIFSTSSDCSPAEARLLIVNEVLKIVQEQGATTITGDSWQHLCRIAELSASVSHAGNDTEVLTTAFRIVELIHHGCIVQLGSLGLIRFIACVGAFIRQEVSYDSNLSVNLSAVHIAWSVADFIVSSDNNANNNQQLDENENESDDNESRKTTTNVNIIDINRQQLVATPERQVTWSSLQWDALLIQLRDGGCDSRPEVRQSSLRSLFAVVSTHGHSLPAEVWATCIWDVLLHVVERFETDIVTPLKSDGILTEEGYKSKYKRAAGGFSSASVQYYDANSNASSSIENQQIVLEKQKQQQKQQQQEERLNRRSQWLEVYVSLLEGLPRVVMKFVDFISRHAPNSHKVFGRLVQFGVRALMSTCSDHVSLAAARMISYLLSELAPCPSLLETSDFDSLLLSLNEIGERCQNDGYFTLPVLKTLVDCFPVTLRNLCCYSDNNNDNNNNINNSENTSSSLMSIPQRLYGSQQSRSDRVQRSLERFVSFVESSLNSEAIANSFMFPATVQNASIEFADAVAKLLAEPEIVIKTKTTKNLQQEKEKQQQQQKKSPQSSLGILIGTWNGVASAWLSITQLFLSRIPSQNKIAELLEIGIEQQKIINEKKKKEQQLQQQQQNNSSASASSTSTSIASAAFAAFYSPSTTTTTTSSTNIQQKETQFSASKFVARGCQPQFVSKSINWMMFSWPLIDIESQTSLLSEILHISSAAVPLSVAPECINNFIPVGNSCCELLLSVIALSFPRMTQKEEEQQQQEQQQENKNEENPAGVGAGYVVELLQSLREQNLEKYFSAASETSSSSSTKKSPSPPNSQSSNSNPNSHNKNSLVTTGNNFIQGYNLLHYQLSSPPKFLPSRHSSLVKISVSCLCDAIHKSFSTFVTDTMMMMISSSCSTTKTENTASSTSGNFCLKKMLQFSAKLFVAMNSIATHDLLLESSSSTSSSSSSITSEIENSVSQLLDVFVKIAAGQEKFLTSTTKRNVNNSNQEQEQENNNVDDNNNENSILTTAASSEAFDTLEILIELASQNLVAAWSLLENNNTNNENQKNENSASSSSKSRKNILSIDPRVVEDKVVERTEKLIQLYLQESESYELFVKKITEKAIKFPSSKISYGQPTFEQEQREHQLLSLSQRVSSCLMSFVEEKMMKKKKQTENENENDNISNSSNKNLMMSESRKRLLSRVAKVSLPLISRANEKELREAVEAVISMIF